MSRTITSELEAQGLEAAEHEFEERQHEAFAEPGLVDRVSTLVRQHPSYSMLAGLGLGIGLGLLIRGLTPRD